MAAFTGTWFAIDRLRDHFVHIITVIIGKGRKNQLNAQQVVIPANLHRACLMTRKEMMFFNFLWHWLSGIQFLIRGIAMALILTTKNTWKLPIDFDASGERGRAKGVMFDDV